MHGTLNSHSSIFPLLCDRKTQFQALLENEVFSASKVELKKVSALVFLVDELKTEFAE